MEIIQLQLSIVNVYLVRNGSDYFLIDTGLAYSRANLEKALKKEGVKPADIRLVIVTHGDFDHIGNCAYLQEKYGIKIAVHSADADMCIAGTTNPNRKRKASLFKKLLRPIKQRLIYAPLMKRFPLETFEPDMYLWDGQDLNDIGLDAKVVHIPGHTMGSVGILTGECDFFAGDTMNNRKKPAIADIIENEALLASSLEKINKLSIRNVYPGHGKLFPMACLQGKGDLIKF